MDILNCKNVIMPLSLQKGVAKKDDSLIENAWCNNAADAIQEAFSNMDDFIALFKESQSREM